MGLLFSLDSFYLFSSQHIYILLIFSIPAILITVLANAVKNDSETVLLITKILIGFTIFQEVCDYSNRYMNDALSLSVDLPFHICNYVLLLSIIALYNRNEYLFNFCYFNAFSGALMANLTPDVSGVVGDVGLFFFFLHHFLIIINVLWMIFSFGMIPSFKGLLVTAILLNVFAIPVGLINLLIGDGANYMYLCEKPPVENALLIGDWPMYMLSLEFIALIIFIILLTPFKMGEILKWKLRG